MTLSNIISLFNQQDLKDDLRQELDFELEGKNGERCAADLKEFKFVHVPRVSWKYCTKVCV